MFARSKFKPALLAVLLATVGFSAHADLARVGPTNNPAPPGNGFPLWYQDLNGTVLDLCLPNATDPGALQQAACLLTGIAVNPPFTFPNNFPDELFYMRAVSPPIVMPGGKRATIVLALEGAFATGAVQAGQQMVFTRIRVTAGVPQPGVYTITHPYGVETIPVDTVGVGNRDIFLTDDVGLAPGVFTDALHSRVGPFLQRTDSVGTPLGPVTLNGAQFLSDGVAPEFVTGSPFGTNYVMICGTDVNGAPIVLGDFGPGGVGTGNCVGDKTFSLTGRLHNLVTSPIGSPLAVKAATYGRDAGGTHVDAYANVIKVLATQPNPKLTVAALNQVPVFMSGPDALGNFYAQGITDPSGALPGALTVINSADNPPSTVTANAVDVVSIASANYDPATDTLTVVATSSDKGFGTALPPTMALEGYPTATVIAGGIPGDLASMTLTAIDATPPASIAVVSTAGGIGRADVIGGQASPVFAPGVVFAQDDFAAANSGGAAVPIDVLSNDVANIAAPPNAGAVTILAPGLTPNLGALTANATGTVTFTPTALSGVATFRYTVSNAVGASNPALVTITVAPPAGGPVPVAAADGPVTVSASTSVNINVLANDSGNGGTLAPATVTVTNITGGSTTVIADGTVTYTAGATAGTFGFDYTVANSNGNVSAPAHVTVTIVPPEQIAFTRQQCKRAGTLGDWNLRGTSTVATGSITIYNTATVPAAPTAAQIVGTVPITLGAWSFNLRGQKACTTPVSLLTGLGTKRENIAITIQ